MLTLINGKKKPKHTLTDEQKAQCYVRMAQSSTSDYLKTQSRWALTKAVYNGVRLLNIQYRQLSNAEFVPIDVWHMTLQSYNGLEALMSLMTPEEIIRTFPIAKTYDGEKNECADYFSTLSLFDGMDRDKSLLLQHKEPIDVLFGYQNRHIMLFLTGMFGAVDILRRADGEDDLFTSFCKEQGLEPPHKMTMHKDADGKQYMMDEDGRTFKVHKPKPRYLKVVK